MKIVIVTGATGFIGANMIEVLSKAGVNVLAVCRPDSENIGRICKLKNVKIINGDLERIDAVVNAVQKMEIDAIYHLAWNSASGKEREDHKAQVQNVIYASNVFELAKRIGCKKIIVTGTVSEKLCKKIGNLEDYVPTAYYLFAKRYIYDHLKQACIQAKIKLVWITFVTQ